MKKFNQVVSEVAQPLSQGEKNFKALHGPVEAINKNMVPGITDQDHIFKGTTKKDTSKPASYEPGQDVAAYDKTLKTESTIEEKTLTAAEKAKREEIAKAMERKNPGMPMAKKMAIATAQAKKVAEDYEYDYEGAMAKAELNAIADKAATLAEMMEPEEQLEAWLQSKITKAKSYIDGVHDYLMYHEGEKEPENYSQSGAMASNYGQFMNRMGEETELDEKLTDDAKKNIRTALGPKTPDNELRKSSASAKAMIAIAKTNPKNVNEASEKMLDKMKNNDLMSSRRASKGSGYGHAADAHFAQQSPKMQSAINMHLRKGKSYDDAVAAAKKHVKEDVEQIDEISKSTLASYAKKAPASQNDAMRAFQAASDDASFARRVSGSEPLAKEKDKLAANMWKKAQNRFMGHKKAIDKLAKEEVDLDENTLQMQISDLERKIMQKRMAGTKESDLAPHKQELAALRARKDSYHKMKKEEVDLDEARRGRPRKDGSSSEDQDGGREHIVVQLRKAENLRGDKHVEFNDGSKHKLPLEHVKKALNMHTQMKPMQKAEFEARLARSHSSFKDALEGKPAEKAKPKISLGGSMKENADPTSRRTDRGDVEPVTVMGPDGRLKVVAKQMPRKEISIGQVTKAIPEELKGDQHKIDANKNNKIDAQDFKILRKKKVSEELKGDQHKIDANKNNKIDAQDFKILRKKKVFKEDISEEHNDLLNRLYDSLSENNRARFMNKLETQQGVDELIRFAQEQGF